jgi:hypothetical protein
MILAGCTSSTNSNLVQQSSDDMPGQDIGMAPDMQGVEADMLPPVQPDMLTAPSPDLLAVNTPDMLQAPDLLTPPDLSPAPDMTPEPDLLPAPPDLLPNPCHSNATNYPGDTATWCSSAAPIHGNSQGQALEACQQYNGPARNLTSTCYICTYKGGVGNNNPSFYLAYSAQNQFNAQDNTVCVTSTPAWVFGVASTGSPVLPGDIGNPTGTSLQQYGRWAP